LKITEDILGTKLKVEVSKLAYRECPQTGQKKKQNDDFGYIFFVYEEVRSVTCNHKSGRYEDKNRRIL
jgi:hypothetical protein